MLIFCYLFNERKSIGYLWLYLIYFLKIVTTFTYTLTDCELIPRCMNEYNISTVEYLSNITCSKSTPCDVIDASSNSRSQNSYGISLEKLNIIKQDNVSSLVKITLAASLPPQHGIGGLFLFQITFGDNDTCYNFVIPVASLFSEKESFVLPCIQLYLQFQHDQRIFVDTYYKEFKESKYEIITLQAAKYTLKDTSTVQVLQSGFMNIVPVLHKRYLYLTSNVDEVATCPSLYDISIMKSVGNYVCDPFTQKIVCRWISSLKSLHLGLNCTGNNLIPSQTYCIYVNLLAREECKYIYPDETVQITFFKISPEKFYNDIVPLYSCHGWNATVHVKITLEKKVVVEFSPWYAYDNCFFSYEFHLYTVRSHDCGAGIENPIHKIYVYHTQEGVTEYFPAIPNGTYCFLVIPCVMDKCYRTWSLRYRKSIVIEDQVSILTPTDPTENSGSWEFNLNVMIAMVLLILISGFVLIRCLVKKLRNAKDFDDYEKTDIQLSNLQKEDVEQESIPLMMSKIIVYIFHSFDEDTQKKVRKLMGFLQTYANIEVKTIREESYKIITHSSYKWFRDIINKCDCDGKGPTCRSNIRFIIVLSASALELFAQRNNNFQVKVKNEENVFRDVLHYMLIDSDRFLEDYFHIFKVCFDDMLHRELRGISSGRCYNVMIKEFVLDLCMDLRASTDETQKHNLSIAYENHEISRMSLIGS